MRPCIAGRCRARSGSTKAHPVTDQSRRWEDAMTCRAASVEHDRTQQGPTTYTGDVFSAAVRPRPDAEPRGCTAGSGRGSTRHSASSAPDQALSDGVA